MNVVLIVIDTLRYDHIRANANPAVETPNLDELTARSWAFDRAYAASYPTIPHRTDAITGRYGAPFHAWKPLDCDVLTLPRALADHGYCTQLIHDTPHLVNGGHNFDFPFHAWTFCRGAEVDRPWIDALPGFPDNWAPDPLFDAYPYDDTPLHNNTAAYVYANRKRRRPEDWNCAKLFRTAAQFLRDNATRHNFFLWLDCFDPHEPWDAPPEFVLKHDHTPGFDGRLDPRSLLPNVRNDPGLPEPAKARIRAFYAAKVSWVDHWLGHFLHTLGQTGLADDTAILLTADHGTNLGERGRFGKGHPVRQQEAHVPFIVHHPGGGAGRSDIIVQPQDIFATVMGLAGLPAPDGLDSHDVLAIARSGGEAPRPLALSGGVARPAWAKSPEAILFTVFGHELYLEFALRPEHCRLTRLGTLDNVDDPAAVERLRTAGIGEIERRGADPALVAWLRSSGQAPFPTDCRFSDAHPAPPGWRSYFAAIYHGGIDGSLSPHRPEL